MLKNIIRTVFIILLFFQYSYSISFSEDTVEQVTPFFTLNPFLYLENDSNKEIIVDSIKIILLKGNIFEEIYIVFELGPTWRGYMYEVHSQIVKENDTSYSLKQYNNKIINTISMIPNSRRKIEQIGTGTGLGPQPTVFSKRKLYKTSQVEPNYDYKIKLILYSNDNTTAVVLISGFIAVNTSINLHRCKTLCNYKTIQATPTYFNVIGRKINLNSNFVERNILLISDQNKNICINPLYFQNNRRRQ